jgi:hypothetical protein
MVDTVNALTETVRRLAGHVPGVNNKSNPTTDSASGRGPGSKTQKTKKPNPTAGRFTEVSRATQQVIVRDTASGASLIYTQITKLVMQDTVTGEKWEWNL